MAGSILAVLVGWVLLSIPVGLFVGHLFARRHAPPRPAAEFSRQVRISASPVTSSSGD